MSQLESLILAAVVIVLYSLASVRFSKAVQPLRLRVVRDIQEILCTEEIPDDV